MTRNPKKTKLKHFSVIILVGVLSGLSSSLFLVVLDRITSTRLAHEQLLYLLPLAGLLLGWLYQSFGKQIEAGNNLIIDEFHSPKSQLPLRMAPFILFGTWLTHLVGGSAGREGTAVQMGAAIADQLSLHVTDRRTLLMAGMSGGFASVFGVPFAGMIFGLEVLSVGSLHLWALVECASAAFIAHGTAMALGIEHSAYPYLHLQLEYSELKIWFAVIGAGLVFGLFARFFSWWMEKTKYYSRKLFPSLPLRASLGGLLLLSLYLIAPYLQRYSGLGVPIILESFHSELPLFDSIAKAFFTIVTLAFGFKGGEVTPLLFMGASLGNALSTLLPGGILLLSALGLVSVFAGAANTPITCIVMAAELFGYSIIPFAIFAVYASYLVSGRKGIYSAQKLEGAGASESRVNKKGLRLLWRRPDSQS